MPSTAAPLEATKGERTKARILDAAIGHFAALGLHSGSVPEIARMAGTSHATVYQHFGKKEDLFREAVESDLTALFASLDDSLSGSVTPEGIVGLVPALLVEARLRPLARRVIADTDREQTEALLNLPALRDLEERLRGAVSKSQKSGTIRKDIDAAEIAGGLIGIALPLLVVAFRLDGMPSIPRAASALDFLAATLRPTKR